MPNPNDQTCAVCGGTWGEPRQVWIGRAGPEVTCPADCHDPEKWAALDAIVEENRLMTALVKASNLFKQADRIAIDKAVAAERERCAQVADEVSDGTSWSAANEIRALPEVPDEGQQKSSATESVKSQT